MMHRPGPVKFIIISTFSTFSIFDTFTRDLILPPFQLSLSLWALHRYLQSRRRGETSCVRVGVFVALRGSDPDST